MSKSQNLFDAVLRVAQAGPTATALLCRPSGQVLSYAQLASLAGGMAQALAERGIERGDRVASLSFNEPLALALFLGLAKLGAIWVPLNWRLAPQEWRRALADCSPKALVVGDEWLEAAKQLACSIWGFKSLAESRGEDAPSAAQRHDPALIVYTSGTTGTPKGAVHTHANLLANMAAATAACGITSDDVVLSCLPLFHVGGLCIHTLPALGAGATVVVHERFDAAQVLQSIESDKPSLLLQVPTTMAALCAHPNWAGTSLGSLRAVWAGSSIVSPSAVAAFHARGLPVCNVYGCTESGPVSVVLGADHAADRAGWVGWPALGVEVKLLNTKPNANANADVGEIALRAPNVVANYWPDIAAVDEHGFLHTGDLAEMAADGCLRVVGRATELIISGGENVYPAEVEAALLEHPDIAACAAFGMPDARWGEVVCAAVVLRPENDSMSKICSDLATLSEDSLDLMLQKKEQSIVAHLSPKLAGYKQPRRIHFVQSLPLTALGKVQKVALKAMLT